MEPVLPCLFFDYVDPLSYLVEHALSTSGASDVLAGVRRVPLELRPPPSPLLDPDAPEWRNRWELARTEAPSLGLDLAEPALVPWTRKAHELVLHAAGRGVGEAAHRLVFDAVFRRGLDVGRVDVLVGLARELGLDATEAKAVLDVDRHAAEVSGGRELAARLGVTASPALVSQLGTLQGFHNSETLRTFLLR